MKRLWKWCVLALLAAGCATTSGTSSGTATRPESTRRPPAYFDLAVPAATRGEYRVYRFNRVTRKLALLRTVTSVEAPTRLKQFVEATTGSPLAIRVGEGSTVAPTWNPPPPPPPPTGDGLWPVPPAELSAATAALTRMEEKAPTKVLVGQTTMTAP